MIMDAIMANAMGGGAGLPVVELTTIPTAEGARLTDEEVAKMETAFATKKPIIISFSRMEGVPFSGVFDFCELGDQKMAFAIIVAFGFEMFGVGMNDGVYTFKVVDLLS